MPDPHEHSAAPGPAIALMARLAGVIPTLQTERLRLRPPRLSDFAVYADIALSPRGRFLLEAPDREAAWYDFMNMVACWLMRGHGLWTVERKQDGAAVGFVLIGFEPGDHEPELGYMFAAEAEGRGYATEAARAAKVYAFHTLGFSTLVSTIDHDNAASFRVARRLGGVRDREAEAAHNNEIAVMRYRADDDA